MFEAVLFYVFSLVAMVAGVGVVTMRNPIAMNASAMPTRLPAPRMSKRFVLSASFTASTIAPAFV